MLQFILCVITFLKEEPIKATSFEIIGNVYEIKHDIQFSSIVTGKDDVHSVSACACRCLNVDCCIASYNKSMKQCYIADAKNLAQHYTKEEAAIGWTSFQHKMKKKQYVDKKLNWTDARNYCTNWGGRLASVSSKCEHEYLKFLVSKSVSETTGVWIDGTDSNQEGNYMLSNPTRPMTHFFWDERMNEPNGGDNENCLNYYTVLGYGVFMNDGPCGALFGFICEQ